MQIPQLQGQDVGRYFLLTLSPYERNSKYQKRPSNVTLRKLEALPITPLTQVIDLILHYIALHLTDAQLMRTITCQVTAPPFHCTLGSQWWYHHLGTM